MPYSSVFRELLQVPRFIPGSMNEPVVSFLCPTYGRAAKQPEVMNELIYWFTRQTYSARQLLILNDCPDQTLVCNVPGVHIINFPYRIKTLGEKRNLLVSQAAGAICLPMDDDDIPLPWRAEQAVLALHDYEYWSPMLWWFEQMNRPMVVSAGGVGHNCSAFRRSHFIGRYELTSGDEDMRAHAWAMSTLRCNRIVLQNPNDISYVYRWGVSRHHISSFPQMQEAYDNMPPGEPGIYMLEPVMGKDYEAMHHARVEEMKSAGKSDPALPPLAT